MSSEPVRHLSPEEYLEIERAAPAKSEYLYGQMLAMAGASPAHNLIVGNLIAAIRLALRGGPCRLYPGDQRVKVSDTGLYTYPDLTVACGDLSFENRDTLLNPALILEVLSPSTESYDRGVKFAHYQALPSLREYVLVCQDQARVKRFARLESGDWQYSRVDGLDGTLELVSVGCELRLADIYEDVELADAR